MAKSNAALSSPHSTAAATRVQLEMGITFGATLLGMWFAFAGFMIPRPSMPDWWRWFFYITPPSWSVYALVADQLGDRDEVVDVAYIEGGEAIKDFVERTFGCVPAVSMLHAATSSELTSLVAVIAAPPALPVPSLGRLGLCGRTSGVVQCRRGAPVLAVQVQVQLPLGRDRHQHRIHHRAAPHRRRCDQVPPLPEALDVERSQHSGRGSRALLPRPLLSRAPRCVSFASSCQALEARRPSLPVRTSLCL